MVKMGFDVKLTIEALGYDLVDPVARDATVDP